jgi:hypothetical protein
MEMRSLAGKVENQPRWHAGPPDARPRARRIGSAHQQLLGAFISRLLLLYVLRPNATTIWAAAYLSCRNVLPISVSSRGSKVHRNAVNAIAQMRGRWPIVEDVAKVAPTTAAVHLGTNHPVAAVLGSLDRTLHRIVETRPTSPTLEFPVGHKQRLTTSGTNERAGTLLMIERTAPRGLRAMCPHDLVLFRGQNTTPLSFGVGHWVVLGLHDDGSLCSDRGSNQWSTTAGMSQVVKTAQTRPLVAVVANTWI